MMSDNRIPYSVGAGGVNQYADVKKMQKLLIDKGVSVGKWKDDGHCGIYTVQAIKKFQAEKRIMVKPDGRIDKDGKTWKILASLNPNMTGNAPTASVDATVLVSAEQPQVSTPLSSGGNVAKLIQVMEFIVGFQCAAGGFSSYGAGINALIQKARNLDPTFLSDHKSPSQPVHLCASYVKMGLAGAEYTNSLISCGLAKNMGTPLSTLGFTNVMDHPKLFGNDEPHAPFDNIPDGTVIIYKTINNNNHPGHIEVWSKSNQRSYSDYRQNNPITNNSSTATQEKVLLKSGNNREVIGVYIKTTNS
jgi:hypothetical protein